MIRLTYIWHDCFLLQWAGGSVVFDYWTEPGTKRGMRPSFMRDIDPGKPLYVVVSHHHKDHYSTEIFNWVGMFPHIHYILSGDTAHTARPYITPDSLYKGAKADPETVSVITPGGSVDFGEVWIRAFGSTAIGNSYLLEVAGRRIFHAGDLNAWLWKDESTPAEIEEAMEAYMGILEEIAEVAPEIDICMFPVDSRIGRDYFTGAREFVRTIDVRHFFPMHFALGDEEERRIRTRDALRFSLYANPDRGDYIGLTAPGAAFAERRRQKQRFCELKGLSGGGR